MKKNSKLFMAFSKGAESKEAVGIKRYIGVAPCFVKAVNPNKEEFEKLFNAQLSDEPSYVGTVEVDGTDVPNVRLSFVLQPDVEKVGFEVGPQNMALFLQKRPKYNKDHTKVQVIDKYGRTAWVTIEQAKNHEIPVYSNGPANLDKDYRPAYVGEAELTDFLKAYLCIPNAMRYVNNTWVPADNLQDCEARLENIDKLFKGDFSEIGDAIALQPLNKVKVLFGVRTTDDNKQYQAFYTQMFLRNSAPDYSRLDKDVQERKLNGAYPTTEFEVVDFHEYNVEATNFTPSTEAQAPENDPLGEIPTDGGKLPWEN